MAEVGQGLALLCKTLQHGGTVHATLEQLDRRTALVAAVSPVGLKHLAHATGTQWPHDLPGAQALAGVGGAADQRPGG